MVFAFVAEDDIGMDMRVEVVDFAIGVFRHLVLPSRLGLGIASGPVRAAAWFLLAPVAVDVHVCKGVLTAEVDGAGAVGAVGAVLRVLAV